MTSCDSFLTECYPFTTSRVVNAVIVALVIVVLILIIVYVIRPETKTLTDSSYTPDGAVLILTSAPDDTFTAAPSSRESLSIAPITTTTAKLNKPLPGRGLNSVRTTINDSATTAPITRNVKPRPSPGASAEKIAETIEAKKMAELMA